MAFLLSIQLARVCSDEFQTAVKWLLGIDTFCVPHVLSSKTVPLTPLAIMLLYANVGVNVVLKHSKLRDVFFTSKLRLVVGSAMIHSRSWPADILVFDWEHRKPAALDLTVALQLNTNILLEVGVTAGAAQIRLRRHGSTANDQKCSDLGRDYVPLAVESQLGKKRVQIDSTID